MIQLRSCVSLVASIAVLSAAASLHAQDSRTVKEPALPPACVTLKANLTIVSVTRGEVEAGADKAGSDKAGLDTGRIQEAIDRCDIGHAVELVPDGPHAAFLTGPISLRPGVTLLIGKSVTLYATRNPEAYALTPGSCGVVNDASSGCKPLITVKSATGSGIMGDGAIDGQGGSPMITGGKPAAKSWWDLADDARKAGHQQAPRMIDTDLTDDFTLYRVTLKNSPGTHVVFHRGDGLTAWGVRIDTAKNARNTDGIAVEQSRNITITRSWIRTGDDNIAIQASDGPTTNITVIHDHFYWGHGMSIGSETNGGVSQIQLEDLSLDGPDNGLRIKSNPGRGGLVDDVTYSDICIRDAKNPIIFDTSYSFPGKGALQVPVYSNINVHNVRISGGGRIQLNGFDSTHRIGVQLDGVLTLDNADRYRSQAIHTDVNFGPGPVNLVFTGDDSTVSGKQVKGSLPGCATKFVPFP